MRDMPVWMKMLLGVCRDKVHVCPASPDLMEVLKFSTQPVLKMTCQRDARLSAMIRKGRHTSTHMRNWQTSPYHHSLQALTLNIPLGGSSPNIQFWGCFLSKPQHLFPMLYTRVAYPLATTIVYQSLSNNIGGTDHPW